LFEGDGIGASGLIKLFSLSSNLNASGIVCVKVSMLWRIWWGKLAPGIAEVTSRFARENCMASPRRLCAFFTETDLEGNDP
jgi:hypothetical protein